MKFLNIYSNIIGRILISLIFLMAGINKIFAYTATEGYMQAMGVPGVLLPLVILLEVIGALAIIIGYKTKLFAFLLAGFSMVSAFIFHFNFADQIQSALFMKNMAIAGGFLFLVSNGAGLVSLDNKFKKGE
ncbi:MAG: DoxX family protein [Marinicellaceae bacterium]